jgi:hypothetical protein
MACRQIPGKAVKRRIENIIRDIAKHGPQDPEEKVMNKIMSSRIVTIALTGVFAIAPMVAAQSSSQAGSKDLTITGTVTCSKYAYSKPDRKAFTAAEAIRMCIGQGYPVVIVSGKDVYPLKGDKNQMVKLAGEKVTVTGHVDTDQPAGVSYAYHETVSATSIVPSSN